MHIVLLEPYFTGSHQNWAEEYARFSAHKVTILSLPGRFWKWRRQWRRHKKRAGIKADPLEFANVYSAAS